MSSGPSEPNFCVRMFRGLGATRGRRWKRLGGGLLSLLSVSGLIALALSSSFEPSVSVLITCATVAAQFGSAALFSSAANQSAAQIAETAKCIVSAARITEQTESLVKWIETTNESSDSSPKKVTEYGRISVQASFLQEAVVHLTEDLSKANPLSIDHLEKSGRNAAENGK